VLCGFSQLRHASRGAHDEWLRESLAVALLRQRSKIAAQNGTEIRVRSSRRGAFVLPELGCDFVGSHHVRARKLAAKFGCHRLLMRGVAKREEETDCDCVGLDVREA
jgi:hypothetical protein